MAPGGPARGGLLWEGLTRAPEVCAACGARLRQQEVPEVDDDPQWTALAAEHRVGCPWIASRGRQRPESEAAPPRTA